jgi:nitrite reductase/ring-hydroxylating ferredoxin subunit
MGWQDHSDAPKPGTLLCRIDAVPDGACKELTYGLGDTAFRLLLYRRAERVCAFVNCCPHFSLPLNARPDEFLLLSDSRIMCAHHSAVFRLEDGRCLDGPARGLDLEAVTVSIMDGLIYMGQR